MLKNKRLMNFCTYAPMHFLLKNAILQNKYYLYYFWHYSKVHNYKPQKITHVKIGCFEPQKAHHVSTTTKYFLSADERRLSQIMDFVIPAPMG